VQVRDGDGCTIAIVVTVSPRATLLSSVKWTSLCGAVGRLLLQQVIQSITDAAATVRSPC